MDFALAFTVFTTLFLLELPDKTFIATLVLATRYRPLLVWIGVASAFLVQTVIAVAFGGLLGRLPETPVQVVVFLLFSAAGVLLLRSAAKANEESEEAQEEFTEKAAGKDVHGLKVISTCFLVLFLAEWGDLSQLATAGFVANNGHPVSVGLGAFLALATVSGLGALLGRALLAKIQLATVRRIAGVICLVLALIMLLQLCGVELPAWMPV